jgi:hypothetical protein
MLFIIVPVWCEMDVWLQTNTSDVTVNGLCTAVVSTGTVKVGEGRRILWENDFVFKQNL